MKIVSGHEFHRLLSPEGPQLRFSASQRRPLWSSLRLRLHPRMESRFGESSRAAVVYPTLESSSPPGFRPSVGFPMSNLKSVWPKIQFPLGCENEISVVLHVQCFTAFCHNPQPLEQMIILPGVVGMQ